MIKLINTSLVAAACGAFGAGCSNSMPTPHTMASGDQIFELSGRRFSLSVPTNFKVSHYWISPADKWPATIEWARKPWNSGFLTETRFSNYIMISYYSVSEYDKMLERNGEKLAPGRFRETGRAFHSVITESAIESGRRPLLLRYDLKVGAGVLCAVAEVERDENDDYRRDVAEVTQALRSLRSLDP